MAQFSDNEEFEVDSILQERKRKGVLEYLVKWKGSGDGSETWEPAKNITEDCAQAVKKFLTSQKAKRKRSTSRSRKVSHSRSRSSSRSRKAAASKLGKSPSRSSSRGRQQKVVAQEKVEEKTQIVENTRSARASRRTDKFTTESNSETEIKTATKTVQDLSKSEILKESQGRVLRSSTMDATARQRLEVQRVHNEQRPVHENDSKPRSAIWKIADYAVIALFILSLLAALFLFLEKFLDLEEFKKQALPNMGVLKRRLEGAQQRLVDLAYVGMEKAADVWLYLIEQIKGTEPVKAAKDAAAPGA